MLELTGYQMIEMISKSGDLCVYRIVRSSDQFPLLAKMTSDPYTDSDMTAAFQYEYDALVNLEGGPVLEPYGFETVEGKPVLLLHDPGWLTVEQWMLLHRESLHLEQLLRAAMTIAQGLHQLHKEQIVIYQLTPSNLLLSDDLTQVRYLDIGLSPSYRGDLQAGRSDEQQDRLLPYLSPEQTGRMGRASDYRSNFYSLGTILYEWFARSLPFQFEDALDQVHRHLAATPELIHKRNPSIPCAVSEIVNKCMEKMPEARYASAYGIVSDLEECLVQHRVLGKIRSFPLARHDISWFSAVRLLGRSAEQEVLRQAVRRVSEGASEVVGISGGAGVGKTALVLETLRDHDTVERIIVSAGSPKLSVNQTPYSLWIRVMEQLVERLLTLSDAQIEAWRTKVLDVLQGDGQLLIEQIPRLALLIGAQPELEVNSSEERRMRFHNVMDAFLRLFLVRGKLPTVWFIDDLQWADEASIQYLLDLLNQMQHFHHLLLIYAYRDAEMKPPHAMKRMMEELVLNSLHVREIHLTAFDYADLEGILSPVLQGQAHPYDELVQVLQHKTGGNPADVKQFLQELWSRKLIVFDEESRTWQWDIKRIVEMDVFEHMANSMEDALRQLPDRTVRVLGIAAILGKQFDLDMLVFLSGMQQEQVREEVLSATAGRLLQPINDARTRFSFQHDRIWQASYESVSAAERAELHAQIGWQLAERLQTGDDVALEQVLTHLNQAVSRIVLQGRAQELAELNMRAGFLAKQAAAFEASLVYFRIAADLLEEEGWETCYSLTHEAHVERAEAEFRNTNFDSAFAILELLMEKSKTDLERAQACLLMIRLETNSDRFPEVVALGEKALGFLQVEHSSSPSPQQVTRQFTKLRWKLRRFPIESVGELPPMTDVRYQTAMSVLDYISQACFVVDKTNWLSKTLLMIELTLKHGMTTEASIGFIGYTMVLNYNLRQYGEAYKWGKLAYQISKPNPRLLAVTVSSFALCYDSWRRYEPGFLPNSADHAVRESLRSGDLWHANQTLLANCAMLFQFSHPIKDIYLRLVGQVAYFERNGNIVHQKQAAILSRLLSELTDYQAANDPYTETDIESESFLQDVPGGNISYLQDYIYIYQILSGYLLGRYEEAHHALEKCMNELAVAKDIAVNSSTYHYYRVLVLKERYETADSREQTEYLRQIRISTRNLRRIAGRSPENYRHKYMLARAEAAKLTLQDRKAERWYGQALEAANTSGLIHDAAIIAECYGQYGLLRNKQGLAKFYLNEAYESYLMWGALAKTKDMEARYGNLLQLSRGSHPVMDSIDYLSVMNSAQALSGEMEMDKLSRMLMRIMLQNAGGEYGVLVFANDHGWTVEAYGTAEEQHIESIPLEAAEHLVPSAIIEYTARTNEALILHDAAASSMFGRDDYILRKSNKAVLCLPIVYQSRMICQIYMENNLSSGVFDENRLDVLKLLSSQCAISIANAKLYMGMHDLKNSLEDQVVQRTRALEKSMQATSEALAETTVYAERNRIAQEIHDIVGHTLTSTVLQIEAGKRLLNKDLASATKRLQEAQDLVRHSLNEIRNSVHMLKEDKYYDIELALRKLIEDTERNTGVVIHHTIAPIQHLFFMHKKVIYHALQEGLTNGIRHGGSSQFYFNLQDDGSRVLFSLADNGTGGKPITMGFGLKMMKDRVLQLNGTLSIACEDDEGCLLRIELPYTAHKLDQGGAP